MMGYLLVPASQSTSNGHILPSPASSTKKSSSQGVDEEMDTEIITLPRPNKPIISTMDLPTHPRKYGYFFSTAFLLIIVDRCYARCFPNMRTRSKSKPGNQRKYLINKISVLVFDRLSSFLPEMALANKELDEERILGTLEDRQLERVADDEAYIEMVC